MFVKFYKKVLNLAEVRKSLLDDKINCYNCLIKRISCDDRVWESVLFALSTSLQINVCSCESLLGFNSSVVFGFQSFSQFKSD